MPQIISTSQPNARWTVTATHGKQRRSFGYLTTDEAESLCQELIRHGWDIGVVPAE